MFPRNIWSLNEHFLSPYLMLYITNTALYCRVNYICGYYRQTRPHYEWVERINIVVIMVNASHWEWDHTQKRKWHLLTTRRIWRDVEFSQEHLYQGISTLTSYLLGGSKPLQTCLEDCGRIDIGRSSTTITNKTTTAMQPLILDRRLVDEILPISLSSASIQAQIGFVLCFYLYLYTFVSCTLTGWILKLYLAKEGESWRKSDSGYLSLQVHLDSWEDPPINNIMDGLWLTYPLTWLWLSCR